MTVPDVMAEPILAAEAQVVEARGKNVKEAVPIDFQFVRALEFAFGVWVRKGRTARALTPFLPGAYC